MRKKRVIINTLASLLSYGLLFVLGIFTRVLFLKVFSLEFLGYEGLFGSIFLVLSIAEMGAGGMFSYMLFAALAKKDNEEISIIMGMYQRLYRLIGMFVLVAGIVVLFFLPLIIQDAQQDWAFIRKIYLIQLATTLITYFLAYRRALLICDQRSSDVVIIETFYKVLNSVLRIALILAFKNYILYLCVPFFTNLLAAVHIAWKCDRKYPGVFSRKATWKDFKDRNAFAQTRELLISKISTVIFTSSDNILISAICGIATTGMYANYQQISSAVTQILGFSTQAIQVSTGNLIYAGEEKQKRNFFDALDFADFLLGTVCLCEFVVLYQRTITILYGAEFLLPNALALMIGLNFYVNCRGIAYCAYQQAVGHYEMSRWYSVASAVTNIVLSVLFGLKWGIAGILAATVVGNILITIGRAKVTIVTTIHQTAADLIKKEGLFSIVAVFSAVAGVWVCGYYSETIGGFVLAGLTALAVSLGIPLCILCRSVPAVEFFNYVKMTIKLIKWR